MNTVDRTPKQYNITSNWLITSEDTVILYYQGQEVLKVSDITPENNHKVNKMLRARGYPIPDAFDRSWLVGQFRNYGPNSIMVPIMIKILKLWLQLWSR